MTDRDLVRFKSKFTPSDAGCWEWHARRNEHGYGIFVIGHAKAYLAHRVSFEHFHGAIPEGRHVLHRCDNPCCVNPEHLFSGTQADNVRDMIEKGRHVAKGMNGVANSQAKLTPEIAQKIRASYIPRKVTLRELASRYGVSQATCSLVVNGKRWEDF